MRIDTTTAHTALREAFANSIIHCAYTVMGNITVDRFFDKIVLSNPGTMLVSKEEFEEGGHSICRNPLIQKMFVFIGVGEKGGSGAGVIAKGWKDNGWKQLPSLKEVTHPDRVEMTLFIPTFTGDKTIENPAITQKSGDKIGDIMKKSIFDYIVSHPNCKSTDIASCVGLQISQTKWYLNQLTEEGKILPLGANRNRTYCAK